MNTNLLTFGEYLNKLLENKHITVTELAYLTGTKSRNTIQRLLKDQSGISVIESFRNKLQKVSSDWLTVDELRKLNQAVEVSRFGKNRMISRHILYNLNNVPMTSITDNSLNKLFPAYSDYVSIHILIYDLLNTELTAELTKLIRSTKGSNIIVNHIITLNHNVDINAEAFSAIFRLLNYKYYNPYYQNASPIRENIHTCFSDIMIIKKVAKDGSVYTDLFRADVTGKLSALHNNPGEVLYHYFAEDFSCLKSQCIPIRMSYSVNAMTDRLADLCEYLLTLERSSSEYLIKHNMCIQMIPTDILYNMLVDSDFLGISEADPGIQRLIRIITERFYNYYHTDKLKVQLFTKRGLIDFVNNHLLSDHFYQFREFTVDELRLTLTFIINQLKTNEHFKMYILKEDYKIGNIEFVYYENQAVYLFDSCSGYDDEVDEGIITAKPFIDIFDDFIKNDLIPNHTYSETETLDFLEHLMSTL